jgi:hypothetical protein
VDAARAEAERLRDQALGELPSLPPRLVPPLREIAMYSVHRAL